MEDGPIKINKSIKIKGSLESNRFGKLAIILIIIIVVLLFNIFKFINNDENIGKLDYVEIENVRIPTLYKYTEYEDTFKCFNNIILSEDDITVQYSSIFLNDEIPQEMKDEYVYELEKLGYEYVEYAGAEHYVLNIDNNTKFIYIMLGEMQIKYGVCFSGRYQDIFK